MNVIVTGSLGFDYIMDFSGRFSDRIMPEKLHQISLSFLVDTLHKQFGGTAGNIAYTLKLLGNNPEIVSSAGKDFSPYKEHLHAHNISTDHISLHKNVDTSAYFVMTDKDDNQIGSFFVGAMKYSRKLDISALMKTAEMVVIAPTDPKAMTSYVNQCRSQSASYLYDPAFQIGNFTPAELRHGIEGAKIFIGNDYEIALVEQKLEISHEELIMMVPILVTTLGSKGSIIETSSHSMHIKPAKPVNDSDPTGAGDAYRAGFLAGYIRGFDLPVCGQMGSVAAVYTVETYGTQTHEFTLEQFKQRFADNYGTALVL